jgi:leucyl-tRNA synthetase
MRHHPTDEERLLWQNLKSKRLGFWFKRQVSFGPYFVDFYCPVKKLVIEIDGSQHLSRKAQEYDSYRTQYLKHFDITVIRFTNTDVQTNLQVVLSKIKSLLNFPPPIIGGGPG